MTKPWPPEYNEDYFPAGDSAYWNRELETMDPEEREEKIILPKLKGQLAYAYEHSPFYQKKMGQRRRKARGYSIPGRF